MPTKLAPQDSVNAIVKVAENYGYDPCHFVTFAYIETGGKFNNTAKNGRFAGLFQLGDGVGGVKGNDRFDPEKSTIGAIIYMQYNQKLLEKWLDIPFEPWMGYMAHQQGAGGFKYLYQNPDMLVNSSPKKKVIKGNLPKAQLGNVQTHQDFLDYWKNYFANGKAKCESNGYANLNMEIPKKAYGWYEEFV